MALSRLRREAQKEQEKKKQQQTTVSAADYTVAGRLQAEAMKERMEGRGESGVIGIRGNYLPTETYVKTGGTTMERPLFTSETSEVSRKALEAKRDAALKKVAANQIPGMNNRGVMMDSSAMMPHDYATRKQKLRDAQNELEAVEKALDFLDLREKYGSKTYDDDFFGQFGANYRLGELQEKESKAWSDAAENPAARAYAENIGDLIEQVQRNNKEALDDEGAVLPWISRDLAGWLPQGVNQTVARGVGTVAGGAVGLMAGAPVQGARTGAAIASGAQSFDSMRGSAYQALVKAGVDPRRAQLASVDEAFLSSVIESAETYLMYGKLGGKALAAKAAQYGIGGDILKAAIEGLASSAAKDAAKTGAGQLLKGYLGNIASEGAEEGLQQAVSAANVERMLAGENPSMLGLAGDTAGTLWDSLWGHKPETAADIAEAAAQGAKIAAMTGAGRIGGSYVAGKAMDGASYVSDPRRKWNQNVSRETNTDVSQADPVMQAALEVVEAEQGVKQNVDGVKQNVDTTTESTNRTTEHTNRTTQEPSAVAPTQTQDGVLPADSKLPTQQKKTDRSRPAPNYGKHGTEAFDKIVSETGAEPAAVQRSFETFYQAGLTDIPVKKMSFVNRNQEDAYFAGRKDYALSLGENKQKGATLQGKGGLVQNELSAALDKDTATTLDNMGRATGTKIILDESMRGGDANGRYENGEIHISPDAEDPVMVVAKHELTHHLQVAAPEAYAAFRSYAIQKMNAAIPAGVSTVAEAKQSRYFELSKGNIDLTTEEAMDEVAAELTEYLLSDEKHMREFIDEVSGNAETRTWAQKFFDAVHEFIEKIKRAFGKGDTALADKVAEAKYGMTVKQLEQAEKLWKDAIKAAGENAAKAEMDSDGIVTNAAGETVAQIHDNGSAQFSLKTYKEDGRDYLKTWLDKRVSSKQLAREDADDIVRQLDEYYDLCQTFMDKYAPFGAWSNAEVIKDNKGKPVFSVVKKNGEYAMNLDFSLVCKKRRTLDAVFGEMIRRGIMDNVDLGEAEISKVNDVIRESGFETACALCFVDAKRYRQAKVADAFVDQYNELVKMMIPAEGYVAAYHFDFADTGNYKDTGTALHTLPDSAVGPGIVKLKKVMQENGKLTVAYKIAKHLMNNPQDRRLVARGEFMNTDGFGQVQVKNPKVLSLYNSSKGSGGPKASFSDVQYLGDILKKNNFTPAKAYAVGGVRIQSFSDYIPRLVFDYLQMIGDLAAKKLPAHAYTKEAIFAQQFGMTGIKLNLSLVPAVDPKGIAPGLDADGNYTWFDGQSFGSDVNVKGSAQTGFELAKQIQNAEGYSRNCGTIAVGISDEHIWKMLDDPDIRMVIPYHKSSLNHIVAVMNNIDQYKDYTGVQNTRSKATGSKISGKDFNYNEALRRTGDAKTAANEYLAWCEKNGYLPKFDTFVEHENYYKLLEDFSTYDNGEAVPQGPVTMTFPKEGDAFGSMAQLIEQGLDEDAVLEGRRDKSIPGIVDKVESVLGHGLKPAQNGSTMDAKYSLKENGNDRRSAENRRERSELESRPGNYEENESIRRFYAEAESRGQTVRVFGGNQKDGGRTSGRPGRFSEVTGDARSENAVATQKELAKLGIESFVHTGDLEILGANGTIYSGGDAGSINKSAVGISNGIKIAPKNTAGHEAFHHWRGRPGRAEYAETVYGGLDWTSEALWGLNDWINKQYFDGKFDPTDTETKDYKLKLILYKEEMVAYITGRVHNGEDVSDMINNMADAKAMWEAFVAEQVGQNGKKFSLKDSSALNREIERILTEGKRTKRKAADIQADIRAVVGQTYRAMTDEYGAFEPGEKATRDVQVPKKTGKNEHVSQTVRTVMEAGATPDAALETIEELTARGEFSYERLTNKQAMADAEATIRHKGYDDALADWTAAVSSGQVNAANTAMGWALYNAAVNDGDAKKAMSILSNIIRHQRDAAQAVQATRILKMMGPDATLYGVQRSVDAMMDDLRKKYGDQAPNLKINEELVKKFREAKDDEARDAALKEIYKDIGRQIPSNWVDKWNAWRYMAMLTNPTTHVRNVLGNAFFAPVVATKDLAATTIESAVHFVSGGKVGRTKAMPGRKLLQAAWGDYKNVAEELMAGGKYSDSFMQNKQVQEGRKIFKNRALEAIRRGNSGLMEVEDAWFAQPHYAFALAQYCKANGITAEQLQKGKALGNARAYAIREAQKATYRDTNMFSQTISDLGKYNGNNPVKKGVSMVTEGILPFRKTPANILVRGLEYSPLGLLKGLTYDLRQVSKEKMTVAEAIDNISAGLTGTGLLALGIYMAAEGLIRGSGGEDDDEIEFEELMGHQAYSMELPDGTSATLDWLAPECLPFFVGVNLYEQAQESKESVTMSDILTAAGNVTEPMLAMSCLQSLNDVFDSVGYVTSEGLHALPKALASSVTSYLTQAFPTLLGKFERADEDVRMTTFTEKNAFLTSDLQYTIGSISNRIPGWDYNQIPYIDAWGRTESTGTKGDRVFNNFANPAYMSEIQTSPMEEELLRLYEATGEGSVLPNRAQKYFNVDKEKYYLTGEQYVQYATTKGQMSYQMLGELTSDSIYKGLPDEEKVKTVSKIYEYANAKAKTKVSDYVLPAWIQKADKTIESTGISAAKYLAIYQMENNIGSLKQAGETIDNSHGLLVMEMIQGIKGLSDKQRTALYEDLNVGKKVRGYSPAKVKQELEKMRKIAD